MIHCLSRVGDRPGTWHRPVRSAGPSGELPGCSEGVSDTAAMPEESPARARDDGSSKRAEGTRGARTAEGLRLPSGSAALARGSRPWEPVVAPRQRHGEKGCEGSVREAERDASRERPRAVNSTGASSACSANPRSCVTDSGGEQGPEGGSAVRSLVAPAANRFMQATTRGQRPPRGGAAPSGGKGFEGETP